jgi:hypothetical protein
MADSEKVVLDGDDVRRTLVRIAHEIVERNADPSTLALVGIHRRGAFLAQRLQVLLGDLLDIHMFITGLLLAILVLAAPNGLYGIYDAYRLRLKRQKREAGR